MATPSARSAGSARSASATARSHASASSHASRASYASTQSAKAAKQKAQMQTARTIEVKRAMEAASCSGDIAAMSDLVARTHPCVTREYCSGYWFPILNAARNGHHEAVRWLAQNGAKPNHAMPTDGLTALYAATLRNHTKVVQVLLRNKAITDQVCGKNKATALYSAVHHNFEVIARLLIRAGANVNHRVKSGATPLYIAVQNNYPSLVEALLKAGADLRIGLHRNGLTPLHCACSEGGDVSLPVIELLLAAGADANVQTADEYYDAVGSKGDTPLLMAAFRGHVGVATHLVNRGGADKHRSNTYGKIPFEVICQWEKAPKESRLPLISLLQE